MKLPKTAAIAERSMPKAVSGNESPYPTLVSETKVNQKETATMNTSKMANEVHVRSVRVALLDKVQQDQTNNQI